MSVEFDRKIHSTLADANLQLAILTATGRLKVHRSETVAPSVLPDYQELRTQAHELKRHTIDNLDHYLEMFERSVEAHGGQVTYCKDATEVADFVLELAKRRNARLIVKSKSMTTEELDLNERLEHHNLESVETDLGNTSSNSPMNGRITSWPRHCTRRGMRWPISLPIVSKCPAKPSSKSKP